MGDVIVIANNITISSGDVKMKWLCHYHTNHGLWVSIWLKKSLSIIKRFFRLMNLLQWIHCCWPLSDIVLCMFKVRRDGVSFNEYFCLQRNADVKYVLLLSISKFLVRVFQDIYEFFYLKKLISWIENNKKASVNHFFFLLQTLELIYCLITADTAEKFPVS